MFKRDKLHPTQKIADDIVAIAT